MSLLLLYHLKLRMFVCFILVFFPLALGSGRMGVNNAKKLEVSLFLLYHLKLGVFVCFILVFPPLQ